jgi:hypothetical protein
MYSPRHVDTTRRSTVADKMWRPSGFAEPKLDPRAGENSGTALQDRTRKKSKLRADCPFLPLNPFRTFGQRQREELRIQNAIGAKAERLYETV